MKAVDCKTYTDELFKVQREVVKASDRRIEVYEMNLNGEPVQLGVNWCSIGTVAPDEAAAFAEQLVKAAELARGFKYAGYTVE